MIKGTISIVLSQKNMPLNTNVLNCWIYFRWSNECFNIITKKNRCNVKTKLWYSGAFSNQIRQCEWGEPLSSNIALVQ